MLMIGRKLQREQRQAVALFQDRAGLVVTDVELKDGRLGPVSLSIAPGKIFGIAGVDGNGQKELAELILGIRKSQGAVSPLMVSLSTRWVSNRGRTWASDTSLTTGFLTVWCLIWI